MKDNEKSCDNCNGFYCACCIRNENAKCTVNSDYWEPIKVTLANINILDSEEVDYIIDHQNVKTQAKKTEEIKCSELHQSEISGTYKLEKALIQGQMNKIKQLEADKLKLIEALEEWNRIETASYLYQEIKNVDIESALVHTKHLLLAMKENKQ